MLLSDKDVDEFRVLCKSRLGQDLSMSEARQQAQSLLTLVKAIYQSRQARPGNRTQKREPPSACLK